VERAGFRAWSGALSIALGLLACTTEAGNTAPAKDAAPAESKADASLISSPPLLPSPPPDPPDAAPPPIVECGAHGSGGAAGSSGAAGSAGEAGSAGAAGSDPGASGTGDPDAAAECAPPPSYCADDLYLVYYENGRCVAGVCQWDQVFYECPYQCLVDGCTYNGTR
jgi:hypothetical protein